MHDPAPATHSSVHHPKDTATRLGTALYDAHTPACHLLTDFRTSCMLGDVKPVYQRFLGLRRTILAYLVWEEFELLEPFRHRLPQNEPIRAVTTDLELHRELRALLKSIASLLQGRKAVDRAIDRQVLELLDQLEQRLEAHRTGIQDHLCPALERILTSDEQDAVAASLRKRDQE